MHPPSGVSSDKDDAPAVADWSRQNMVARLNAAVRYAKFVQQDSPLVPKERAWEGINVFVFHWDAYLKPHRLAPFSVFPSFLVAS
jgi:hypothetical protein